MHGKFSTAGRQLATLAWLDTLSASTPGAPGRVAAVGPYTGGEVNKLNSDWLPLDYSGDDAVGIAWDLLHRRARDRGRNDPALIAIRRAMVDGVLRTGIVSQADVLDEDGESDDDFNDESDDAHEGWEIEEADCQRRLPWPDMMRQAWGDALETGDAFFLRTARGDRGRQVPLSYQVLEGEQLDRSIDRPASPGLNEIIQGIEIDAQRAPLAYYLFDAHPGDPHTLGGYDSRRVPAERIMHVMLPTRPSATHGTSLYAALLQPARDLDTYVGSELSSAILGAVLTAVHKSANPARGLGVRGDGSDGAAISGEDTSTRIRLSRGATVTSLGREDSLEFLRSPHPNQAAEPFLQMIVGLLSMGAGISPHLLAHDFRRTTYVAARAASLADAMTMEPYQALLGRTVIYQQRRLWTAQMAAYGRFKTCPPAEFARNPRRWLRIAILPPSMEQLDRQKESSADETNLANGTTSYREIYGRRRLNWRRQLRQVARERKFLSGLPGGELVGSGRAQTQAAQPMPDPDYEDNPQGAGANGDGVPR